jgi:hypothetical protein
MQTIVMKNGGTMQVEGMEPQPDGTVRLLLPGGQSVQVPGNLIARAQPAAAPAAQRAPDVAQAPPPAAPPAALPEGMPQHIAQAVQQALQEHPRQAWVNAAGSINSGEVPYWQAVEQLGIPGTDFGLESVVPRVWEHHGIPEPMSPEWRKKMQADAMRQHDAKVWSGDS